MLFKVPDLPDYYSQVIEEIEDCRESIALCTKRQLESLDRVPGENVVCARRIRLKHHGRSQRDLRRRCLGVVDGETPPNPKDEDWLALTGHRDAMDYVIQLSKDPGFRHNEGTLLGLHFMMMKHDLTKNPGRYRPGPIHVTNTATQRTVYNAPEAETVPNLMASLIDGLNKKTSAHPLVKAAMAHLNLTMIHPFRDWKRSNGARATDLCPGTRRNP